jgi:hypothetical protein
MPENFQPLADAIYRDRVLRARRTPPEERIMDGPRLFDYACAITLAGLRSENPNATENELREALRQRLALAERLEKAR